MQGVSGVGQPGGRGGCKGLVGWGSLGGGEGAGG